FFDLGDQGGRDAGVLIAHVACHGCGAVGPPAAGDHQHPVALVGDDHTNRGAAAALHGFGGGHTGCAPFWSWAPAPRSLSTAVGQGSRRFVVDRAVPPPALPRGRADRGNTRIRGRSGRRGGGRGGGHGGCSPHSG